MKAISIRQPWAYLVAAGFKDIENRTWSTSYRGWIFIHAGQKMAPEAREVAAHCRRLRIDLPQTFDCGGIIGAAYLYDCVTRHRSPWFDGPYGFVLRDARLLPFTPYKGVLGLFNTKGLGHLAAGLPVIPDDPDGQAQQLLESATKSRQGTRSRSRTLRRVGGWLNRITGMR